MQARSLRFELVTVGPGELASFEEDWRALEARTEAEPFATFDWLAAWAKAYAPARLSVLRALLDESIVGLALVEHARGGRWYFAGRPVSSYRGPLCRPEDEPAFWRGLAAWVGSAPKDCALVSAEGLGAGAAAELPAGRRRPTIFRVLELPDSFETYIAERSRSTRQTFRQQLRAFERAGGEVVEAADVPESLRTFLRLHGERAGSKGERHAGVDERLTALLASLPGRSTRLRMWELRLEGRTLAVGIHLERGDTVYFYNTGMDASAARMSPGIVLELGVIRDAIEQGLRRFELGPGDFSYKSRLGGEREQRFLVTVPAPTWRGRAVTLALAGRDLLRSRDPSPAGSGGSAD